MRALHWPSFLVKLFAACALVALADRLFWNMGGVGSNLGGFAFAWALVLAVVRPSLRHDPRALAFLALAVGMGGLLGDDPGLLTWALYWSALSIATLLPREARFGSALDWGLRLLLHAVTSVVAPWSDLLRLRRVKRRGRTGGLRALLPLLPLPLAGLAVFVTLFSLANPVIEEAIGRLALPTLDLVRLMLWTVVLTLVWATLRPRRANIRRYHRPDAAADFRLPGVSVGSVTLSLLVFNALFAVQNGLDIAFLWSGAGLPDGMTLAGYAHRGAYPLIATALLAGLFVLVTLRPGSATAAVPLIRWLVGLWVVQNIFLVASSMLRTIDYIDAYSLTRLRIAALLWMALVAVGLAMILWRMLAGKSATWLINANVAAATSVLIGCSVVDLGSVTTSWNVRHAREVGGRGAALDLCYLSGLGSSALVSLVELEAKPGLATGFADRVAAVRHETLFATARNQQGGWWTWRNARRMAEVKAVADSLPDGLPRPEFSPYGRNCDGAFVPPHAVPVTSEDAEAPDALTPGDAR